MTRPLRGVLIGTIVALLGAGLALPASALNYALDGWVSTNTTGYTHPSASYKVGDPFAFSFDLRNDQDTARTQCLEVQIFRLNSLGPDSTLTEAELETLVHETNTQQVLVKTFPLGSHTFPAHTTKTLAAITGLNFGTGIFQFDMGPCGQNFSPNHDLPLVSGFIRVVAAAVVATPTSTPTPTPTPTPTSGSGVLGSGASTPRTGALTLAATGSGAQPEGGVSSLILLLGLGLLAAAGLSLALRRVR